jgi:hypothetical protein
MTSAEEVPHTPCSIGVRQTEPPVPEEELVHVFLLQHATLTGRISPPRPAKGLTCGGTYSWQALRRSPLFPLLAGASAASAAETETGSPVWAGCWTVASAAGSTAVGPLSSARH